MESSHLNYIKDQLLPEILKKLEPETLDSFEVVHSGGLDGFMSALYNICMKTKTEKGIKERLLIAKFMKGDEAFRESSKSYTQFANEIFIYDQVLPTYEKILKRARLTDVAVEDWVPKVFVAKYGYIEGLSPSPKDRESVLVMENLKPLGYKLGPRLYLNREHLLSMCKPIGEYHALSYVLKLTDAPLLERLRSGIIPLPFINDDDPKDVETNFYRILYRVAFDRLFDFFDRQIDGNTFDKQSETDLKLIERMQRLREKYFEEPTRLLESFRTNVDESEEDRWFGTILHGDFNRNNVLFKYRSSQMEGHVADGADEEEVEDVKLIDFQELRFGTPAIDLSFFMYMNSTESVRNESWMDILKEYHKHMFGTLESIVKSKKTDEEELNEVNQQLNNYKFEQFYAHFSRYAFYGVMICTHFLPWILCSQEECGRLSTLFETDMHGEEFRQLSIEAGGDEVNLKILNVVRHACKMGYMDFL